MRYYPAIATLLLAWQASASDVPSLCANAEQTASVRALYGEAPVPPTFMAAAQLGVSEAIVASALAGKAGKQTVGTSGAGFTAVWESMQGSVRGVTFLDTAGDGIFGIYLPEAAEPLPAQLAKFEKTRAVISALPGACN